MTDDLTPRELEACAEARRRFFLVNRRGLGPSVDFTVPADIFDAVEEAFGHWPVSYQQPIGRSGWSRWVRERQNLRFVEPRNPRVHLRFKGVAMYRGTPDE